MTREEGRFVEVDAINKMVQIDKTKVHKKSKIISRC